MLPRTSKLPVRSLPSFFKTSQRFPLSFMLVYFTQTQLPARFGVSISKKQLALATQRNKIKRRVFQEIQAILKNSPSLTGDYFFVLSARITTLSPTAMSEVVKKAIQLGEKSKTLS